MAKVRHTPRFETCPFTFGRSPRGALSHDSDRSTMRLTHERSTAMKRRHFLKVAAATAFGFHVVPRSVLGGPRFVPPSEKVNIAGRLDCSPSNCGKATNRRKRRCHAPTDTIATGWTRSRAVRRPAAISSTQPGSRKSHCWESSPCGSANNAGGMPRPCRSPTRITRNP